MEEEASKSSCDSVPGINEQRVGFSGNFLKRKTQFE